MRYLKTNTATIVTVGPFLDKTDGVTLETALTITNERISLTVDLNDGSAPTLVLDNVTGATSGTSNDLNYITNNDAGLMQLELAAANVNYLGRAFLTITDAANHCPVFHEFMILPAMVFDSLIAGTDVLQADMTQLLGTAVSTPATAGVLDINLKNIANAAVATGSAQLGVNVVTQANIDFGATQKASITTAASAATPALSAGGVTAVQSGLATAAALTVIDDFLDTEVAAILAAVDTEVAAIKTKTDFLPSATAGAAGGVFIAGANAATSVTTALTANITGNVSGSVGSVTGAVGSVTGAVGSVTGAVGSVTGAVGSVTGLTASDVGAIKTTIGTAGAGLTALGDTRLANLDATVSSRTKPADTQAAVTTVGTTTNLTNLPATAALEATLTAMKGATFAGATDSLEALRDRGDAAWTTATGFATAANLATLAGYVDTEVASILAAVDTEVAAIKTKTDNLPTDPADQSAIEAAITAATSPLATAAALATVAGYVDTEVASILAAVDTEVGALIATVGVAGAGLTALATQASVNTIDDFLDTEVAAILADTNELQTDLVNGGRLDLLIDAIKAKTDVIPASPAATGAAMTLTAAYDAAKTAATQTSVDDVPTNAELATALAGADDAMLTAIADVPTVAEFEARTLVAASYATAAALTAVDDFVDTEVAAIKAVTDKIDTALVLDGAVYQLTANALELAPTGGSAPTAGAVADAVWDEALSGHVVIGSAGAGLSAAGNAGDPWAITLPGDYTSDQAGYFISLLAGIDTSAVTVTASNDAGVLTVIQSVTFGATVSGLTISGTWAKVYWSLKENIYDDDSESIIQLVATNPAAALTDGLLYLDSAAIVAPITHADGTLTVNQAGGIVTIWVSDNATVLLDAASELVWDVKTKDAAGNTVQNTTGTASIVRAVTQTI